ncbi:MULTISPECIES: phage tail protein [Halomonas]|uniref:Tip attachment protein J domain-containing protein n=1 Tax=Halomonas halophila TaxID=29573 RepID=A0ABQ0TZQ9_9GAMM|nr:MULTISPECIES: phage tail protein [Halomonas]MDR5889624.1 phage tail protein [Halomonas salina]WJY06306.1 phage tail protein [Halomonas halophila]GEK71607.1 hypothetical protein HHA04nite_01510 [Halomonas halophila]
MGSKGGDPQMPVTAFYVSEQLGVCHGPAELLELKYGEKTLLSQTITANQTVEIDRPDLFGGEKTEGGFQGAIDVMLGGAGQLASSALAASLQRNGASSKGDANRLPGYRGIVSLFLHGGSVSGRAGANIGSNTAVIKALWAKIRRAPEGCPFDPVILVDGMRLANPAAIIYECLTNTTWGMAGPAANIDDASFIDAAATLASEGFGLALLWHRQESIEEFIGSILDHIEASLALDPFTGRFRLKLVRDDYAVETLPVFGPHNATLRAFDRKGWGETLNEITVKWTNPANEKRETVTVHDTANIALQGGTMVSETRDYPGIRTANLALRVATRDLLAASSALASAELEVNREAWKILPGDVIVLEWPIYGFDEIPMRVSGVDYGKPGDSTITLSLLEDVFGMPQQSYVESDGSAWVNPAIDPLPLTDEYITSAPYFALVQQVGEATAEAVADTSDYDLVFGTHAAIGIHGYDVMTQLPGTTGTLQWTRRGSAQPAAHGLLPAELPREVASVILSLDSLAHGEHLVEGTLVWIGPVDPTGELGLITTVDGSGYTVQRGMLDTVPQQWPAGTPVWGLHAGVLSSTGIERTLSETAAVRLLTRTTNGRLAIADAADVSATMSGRLHRPYRPANVTFDGVLWPDPDAVQAFPAMLAWAGRDRLSETAVVNAWDDGHVTPEDGATFEVELLGEDSQGGLTSFHVEDVGTATSYEIDLTVTPPPAGTVFLLAEVRARRDGLASWQAVRHRVRLLNPPTDVNALAVDLKSVTDLTASAVNLNAPTDVTATEA